MDKSYYRDLIDARLERAFELLIESQELLNRDFYKSANNRAFYAIEKAVKALLASIETDAETHNGAIKQFNYHFIYHGNGTFCADDYKILIKANEIRTASDYDDFYIANKEEAREQVESATYLVNKIHDFLMDNKL